MRINKKIIITIFIIVSIPISIVSFKLISINFNAHVKLFSRDVTNNIIKRQIVDEVWDFEKVVKPDKSGYDLWVIGQEAEEISAAKIASGTTVEPVIFYKKELNMDYKSMEDYDKNNGSVAFRKFIEGNK